MVNSGFVKCPGGACVKAYDGKGHTRQGDVRIEDGRLLRNGVWYHLRPPAEDWRTTGILNYDTEQPPPPASASSQEEAAYAHCRSCGQGWLFPLNPDSYIPSQRCVCGTYMEVALDPAPQHNHYASAGQSPAPSPAEQHNLMHTQEP